MSNRNMITYFFSYLPFVLVFLKKKKLFNAYGKDHQKTPALLMLSLSLGNIVILYRIIKWLWFEETLKIIYW